MPIVLYDLCARDNARRFSPNCWKARMALAHKGLEYETRPTHFTGIKDIGNGFSPTVPVIDDDGRLVRDSFEIALYLEDAYADRSSLFRGDGGMAEARFVESWMTSVVNPSLIGLIIKDIHIAWTMPTRPISVRAGKSASARRLRPRRQGARGGSKHSAMR